MNPGADKDLDWSKFPSSMPTEGKRVLTGEDAKRVKTRMAKVLAKAKETKK